MLEVLENLEYLASKKEFIPHHLNLKSDRRRRIEQGRKRNGANGEGLLKTGFQIYRVYFLFEKYIGLG